MLKKLFFYCSLVLTISLDAMTDNEEVDLLRTSLNIVAFDKLESSMLDPFEIDALNIINAHTMHSALQKGLKPIATDEENNQWKEGLKSFYTMIHDLGIIAKKIEKKTNNSITS